MRGRPSSGGCEAKERPMNEFQTTTTVRLVIQHLVDAEDADAAKARIDTMVRENLPQVFDAITSVTVETEATPT